MSAIADAALAACFDADLTPAIRILEAAGCRVICHRPGVELHWSGGRGCTGVQAGGIVAGRDPAGPCIQLIFATAGAGWSASPEACAPLAETVARWKTRLRILGVTKATGEAHG